MTTSVKNPTVVLVSPHPDDEVLGGPGTLARFIESGWTVVNFLTTTGRLADRPRRRHEAEQAAIRGGFVTVFSEPTIGVSSSDDLVAAEDNLVLQLGELATSLQQAGHDILLWTAPSPHDAHHAHELVGRATRRHLENMAKQSQAPICWWMWGVWADLPVPTVYVPYCEQEMHYAVDVIGAYAGELERNDYAAMIEYRARANVALGSERVFGFGAVRAAREPFADLFTAVTLIGEEWYLNPTSLWSVGEKLDLVTGDTTNPIGRWLRQLSVRDELKARHTSY